MRFQIFLAFKLEQKASVYIRKWLKLHKSITSLSFYSSASPCPLPVRSLTSVLKCSKISRHLLLKHSQDQSVSSCVPNLQAVHWQVEEAAEVLQFITDELKGTSVAASDLISNTIRINISCNQCFCFSAKDENLRHTNNSIVSKYEFFSF